MEGKFLLSNMRSVHHCHAMCLRGRFVNRTITFFGTSSGVACIVYRAWQVKADQHCLETVERGDVSRSGNFPS